MSRPTLATAPAAGSPSLSMKVAGSTYDMLAHAVTLTDWTVYSRDGSPSLAWHVSGGPLSTLPDDFLAKVVELYADEGSGATLVFRGRCEVGPATSYDEKSGWVCAYHANGIEHDGDHTPVTNPQTGADSIDFNLDPANPAADPALLGRNQGQILKYALEAHAAALSAISLGGVIGTIPTRPATAHAVLASGAVTVTVDDGGAGYGSTPPTVVLSGGDGTYTSCTASVASGAVTGISVSGSTGYTTAPEVWVSPLPLAILQDLAKLTVVIPHSVSIGGEKLITALRDLVRQIAPNHWFWVAPDGSFRVLDQRTFTPTTLTLNGNDGVDVANVSFSRQTDGCASRVQVRGGPDTIAVMVETGPLGGLAEDFGHDGLTNTQAKANWSLTNFTNPADNPQVATFAPVISGGAVSSVQIVRKGFGYTPGTYSLTFAGGGGSGAAGTYTVDTSGQVYSTAVTSGGSGYSTNPTATGTAPPGATFDQGTCSCSSTTEIVLTSSNARSNWPAGYWDQSATGVHGALWVNYDVGTGIDARQCVTVISSTSLTAGGTFTVTVDPPLNATNYNYYQLSGMAGGAADVWRKYNVTNANYVGKLLTKFPRPVAYRWASGLAATLTSVPTASVLYSSSGDPPYLEGPVGIDVDPTLGIIRTQRPVVTLFGTPIKLIAGGSNTDGIPYSVRALLAVNRGNLTATSPADSGGVPQYAGTSYTVEGLSRTLTITCPSWVIGGNTANMIAFAAETLDSVKDTVVEGTVPLLAWASSWFTPGLSLNVDGSGYSTPWSSLAAPVVECSVRFTQQSGSRYITTLKCSNRRAAFSAAQYLRPTPSGQIIGFSGGGGEVFDVGERLDVAERRLEDYLMRVQDQEYAAYAVDQRLRELGAESY